MTPNGSDVQIEQGGYARIHNAILEQLALRSLTSREYACVIYLLRMTYGFSRKECKLSYRDFAKATGTTPGNAHDTLSSLMARRIVLQVSIGSNRVSTWSFNKYFEQWDMPESTDAPTSDLSASVPESGTLGSASEGASVPKSGTPVFPNQEHQCSQIGNESHWAKENSKETSKDKVSAPSKKRAKQRQPKEAPAPHAPDPMFERLCWILYGHQNFKTLTKDQRGKLNAECKVLRDDVGASADELATWFKSIWRKEWPGNKGDRPRIDQIRSGVAAYLARNIPDDAPVAPAPTVLPYIVTDSGEYQYVGGTK